MSRGSLTVFAGPMFSGKTSRALSDAFRLADVSGFTVIVYSHSSDVRNALSTNLIVSSHSSITRHGSSAQTKFPVVWNKVATLPDEDLPDQTVIVVDEAQFFDGDELVSSVERWLASPKVQHIFVAGLDGTFYQTSFPGHGIQRLMPMADNFFKLHAICTLCAKEGRTVSAPFTRRMTPITPSLIGGAEDYAPVCNRHIAPPPK